MCSRCGLIAEVDGDFSTNDSGPPFLCHCSSRKGTLDKGPRCFGKRVDSINSKIVEWLHHVQHTLTSLLPIRAEYIEARSPRNNATDADEHDATTDKPYDKRNTNILHR